MSNTHVHPAFQSILQDYYQRPHFPWRKGAFDFGGRSFGFTWIVDLNWQRFKDGMIDEPTQLYDNPLRGILWFNDGSHVTIERQFAADEWRLKDYRCVACQHGHHEHCGMQTWCECNDPRDGTDANTRESCERCKRLQNG